MGSSPRRTAIVGFGPRGLGALEALVRRFAAESTALAVDIFEPSGWPGAGPNFSPDESTVCLLNIPLRGIDLPPPPMGGAGDGFAAWLGVAGHDREAYLPRARLGAYLNARFNELMSRLPAHISVALHPARVKAAERDRHGWQLKTRDGNHGPYDYVLLSVGQPETSDDGQLARWREHADRHSLALAEAYPGTELIRAAGDWAGQTVGIRGLALSALDVVRMLTLGLGGRFEDGAYIASGHEPERIVPFSLDGQAPAPKPASAALDARFDPLPAEDAAFADALRGALTGPADAALEPISTALEATALRILQTTGGPHDPRALRDWLQAERIEPNSQEPRPTREGLRASIAQAAGAEPPSIGYAVGQIWRKWQPLLRRIYDSAPVAAETARAVVRFDEGLKRYSFGPPVDSAHQLLTLIDTGLVDPRAADDPDITLTSDGWRLTSGGRAVTATVMINSVLPQPALEQVAESLVVGLRQASDLQPLGDALGARCLPDAAPVGPDGAPVPGLALAGRLANGSAIASDSIHDCFGNICDRWANAVLAGRTAEDRIAPDAE